MVGTKRLAVFELVTLEPHYPIEFFREFTVPDGTAVYEVAGGKISRSYRQGAPGVAPSSTNVKLRSRLWVFIPILAGITCFALLLRSRRRRRIVAPSGNGPAP